MTEISWLQAFVLALIQGITEFLPVSSSAHLILLSWLTGWPDQGAMVDIAAHFGTLLAVIWFFRRDVCALLTPQKRSQAVALLAASVPLGLMGLLLHKQVENQLRSVFVIAMGSIVFGGLLWLAEKWHQPRERQLTARHLLMMGLWQVLALIPGASRSGVTLTGGLFMGLEKKAAAKGAFLLAIPALMMVAGYGGWKILQQPMAFNVPLLGMVMAVSFLVALLTIDWFMRFLEKTPLSVFAIYRIILGVGLLGLWVYKGA